MIECLILGDSIAVGVSHARPECNSIATGGISSRTFLKENPEGFSAKHTIISLGANDIYDSSIDTKRNLKILRDNIVSERVYWILPMHHLRPKQFEIVLQIASEYSDAIIYRPLLHISNDGVHPTDLGSKIIGEQTK